MVAPVVARNVIVSSQDYYSDKRGFTQARPFNLVLGYRNMTRKTVNRVGNPPNNITTLDAMSTQVGNALLDSCYERFKGNLSDRASIGASLAESSQSIAMIATRAVALRKFTKALRQGNLVQASAALGLDGVPKKASYSKSFSANWLEYHFGWVPLIGDIGSAVQVLQSPVKTTHPTATSKGPSETLVYLPPTDVTRVEGPFYYRTIQQEVFTGSRSVKMGAEVSVSNPNLWLANQLGFVNPVAVVWEVVPFSFVADWFTNVGSFLTQSTDFYGLKLDKAYTTVKLSGYRTYSKRVLQRHYSTPVWSSYSTDFLSSAIFDINRSTGISKPGLFVRPFKVWGWQRAATAVSLLVQMMK